MWQQARRAFLRAEHASHCRIQSTSNEFLREHRSPTQSLMEAARCAVLCMLKKGKWPRTPPARVVRRRMMLESPCYIQLNGHSPLKRSVDISHR